MQVPFWLYQAKGACLCLLLHVAWFGPKSTACKNEAGSPGRALSWRSPRNFAPSPRMIARTASIWPPHVMFCMVVLLVSLVPMGTGHERSVAVDSRGAML